MNNSVIAAVLDSSSSRKKELPEVHFGNAANTNANANANNHRHHVLVTHVPMTSTTTTATSACSLVNDRMLTFHNNVTAASPPSAIMNDTSGVAAAAVAAAAGVTTTTIMNNCNHGHTHGTNATASANVNNNHSKRRKWFTKSALRLDSDTLKWKLISFISLLVCLLFLIHYGLHLSRKKEICLTSACVRTAASLLSAMDQTAEPCEDFFQYACGNWNKQHVIPEDSSSISTFEVLSDQIQVILKGLLEEPVNNLDSVATKKAKDFYLSCMNLSAIRSIGEEPLFSLLKELGGWPVTNGSNWNPTASVEVLMGKIRANLNMGVIIELWIGPDDTNSSNNIIQIDQMQLGLPSRDYFLNTSKEIDAYYHYMAQLAVIFGADPNFAMNDLVEVIKFETVLANISVPEADRHDTSAIYKKHTLAELETEIPDFAWRDYFETFLKTELGPDEPVVSYAFAYLKDMATIIKKADQRTVQNYIVWRVLMELTSHLVDKFQEIKIEFRKVLMGVTSERSRWSQCVEWTNKKLGMALGTLFIRDNFDNVAKETAQEMISNIREAFIELLDENHWMDAPTKKVAKEKALKMNERIGYPDFLTKAGELNKEYANLTVSKNHFLRNLINMGKWKASQSLDKLRKPVNKDKWSTEPAVVNAFYDPNKNDIVFPAGILQPLFYSQYFSKSLNYGGIGVVIGHEITHGFDDKGRQFDSDGNLKEWWNNETIFMFRTQAQCIIDQYSSFEVENFRINGRMTQGENIADNGGLKQAYRAFKKWESTHGTEPFLPGMERMTHDQYFFLNYAQIWCGSMRPEDVLNKIRSAVHSPGPIRVLGPLSNSKDFAAAYSCPLGSRMNPVKKCVLW